MPLSPANGTITPKARPAKPLPVLRQASTVFLLFVSSYYSTDTLLSTSAKPPESDRYGRKPEVSKGADPNQ
jgi:hypothetical protein